MAQRTPRAENLRSGEPRIRASSESPRPASEAHTASEPPSQTADIARANVVEASPSATVGERDSAPCRPKIRGIRIARTGWASSRIVQGEMGAGATAGEGSGDTGAGWGDSSTLGNGGGTEATGSSAGRAGRRRAAGTANEPK